MCIQDEPLEVTLPCFSDNFMKIIKMYLFKSTLLAFRISRYSDNTDTSEEEVNHH